MLLRAELGGGSSAVILAPEVAEETVRRLRVLSNELAGAKADLGAALTPAWQSTAGRAFASALATQQAALQKVIDSVEAAVANVAKYGQFLRTSIAGGPAMDLPGAWAYSPYMAATSGGRGPMGVAAYSRPSIPEFVGPPGPAVMAHNDVPPLEPCPLPPPYPTLPLFEAKEDYKEAFSAAK